MRTLKDYIINEAKGGKLPAGIESMIKSNDIILGWGNENDPSIERTLNVIEKGSELIFECGADIPNITFKSFGGISAGTIRIVNKGRSVSANFECPVPATVKQMFFEDIDSISFKAGAAGNTKFTANDFVNINMIDHTVEFTADTKAKVPDVGSKHGCIFLKGNGRNINPKHLAAMCEIPDICIKFERVTGAVDLSKVTTLAVYKIIFEDPINVKMPPSFDVKRNVSIIAINSGVQLSDYGFAASASDNLVLWSVGARDTKKHNAALPAGSKVQFKPIKARELDDR